jgi:GTPase SAR1 family protein
MVSHHGMSVNLAVWDAPGQEAYLRLVSGFCGQGHIALFVFGLSDLSLLKVAENGCARVLFYSQKMWVNFLVGNKTDLAYEQRAVTKDYARFVARGMNARCHEVSARTGLGVDELFEDIAEDALKWTTGQAIAIRQGARRSRWM